MKSFKSYISLQEQSPEDLTFGEPSTKHYRVMNKPHEFLPVDSDQSLVSAPPSNSSDETRVELMELQDRLDLEKDNEELLDKWDLDLLVPFVKYLKQNNLKYNKKRLGESIDHHHLKAKVSIQSTATGTTGKGDGHSTITPQERHSGLSSVP
jgi:hypothetical protein